MLHLEIHFDSTLLNFIFLFISLFILVTSSCQTPAHPPLRSAPSPTEHLGSHDTPADVTQATKRTDFTHKDPFGKEWGKRCLKLHFRHVHVKLTPAEDFHSFYQVETFRFWVKPAASRTLLMFPGENTLFSPLQNWFFKDCSIPVKNNFVQKSQTISAVDESTCMCHLQFWRWV